MQITSGKITGPLKVVVYGPEGIGKSTFASQFPRPVFIDTEGSTKYLDVARTPAPESWQELLRQAGYIRDHAGEYGTLVLDTADWAEQLCATAVCVRAEKKGIEDFGYGKGYVYLAEEFGKLLHTLDGVVGSGMNVVVTAHAKMRKFEQPDEMGSYDRWELKLSKNVAPLLKEWADMVLFANYKTVVVNVDGQGAQKGKNKAQGGRRVMYTTHHPCWDAKNRQGLKEELPFAFQEIAAYIPDAGPSKKGRPVEEPAPVPETPHMPAPAETPATPPGAKEEPEGGKEPMLELHSLMKTYNISLEEVQKAVAARGYYPEDTPVENYDPDFIKGVLIGAWDQVKQAIIDARPTPF